MRSVHAGLTHWNTRWGTKFGSWEEVKPQKFLQHGIYYNDTALNLFYWDWQHFRHQRIHAAHEGCCIRIAAAGFRCILHFGEFLNSGDAIYASGVVFTLSASPWVDYIVVDSNFQTATGHMNDIRVVQVLISSIKPFGKRAFFEGAFERFNDHTMHQKAVALTVASGAHGVGFTNWLDNTSPTFFEDTLRGYYPRPEMPPEGEEPQPLAPPVAILTPYRSYWAYKGLPFVANRTLASTDPQQDRLFECLNVVEKAVPSLGGLQVFGAPSMLAMSLQHFQKVFYLEPDHLLSGDAKTIADMKVQAAEMNIPFTSCVPRLAPPVVLLECCPSL